MPIKLFVLVATALFGCSCTTARSTVKVQDNTTSVPPVQPQWQSKFEADLKSAGEGSEGWALFSDSSMGHSGQQMVIRYPNQNWKVCYASQAKDQCQYANLSLPEVEKLKKVLGGADALSNRPATSFDGIYLEYVHQKLTGTTLEKVAQVQFVVGTKPLPSAYQQLMDGFTNLPQP